MKFIVNTGVTGAEALFDILPSGKLLTYNLPASSKGLVEAVFTSAISPEDLKKLMHHSTNGSAMMTSFKIIYD